MPFPIDKGLANPYAFLRNHGIPILIDGMQKAPVQAGGHLPEQEVLSYGI